MLIAYGGVISRRQLKREKKEVSNLIPMTYYHKRELIYAGNFNITLRLSCYSDYQLSVKAEYYSMGATRDHPAKPAELLNTFVNEPPENN